MSLTLTLARGGGEVSGSGTNIELDGTIAGGAIESVEMYGDTEQTTYSGKNLYQSIGKSTASGGLISTITSNGEFHVTGTASDSSSTFSTTMNTSLPAGSYVLSITKTLPFNILLRASNNQNIGVITAGNKSVTITTTTTLTSLWVWAYPLTNGTTYDETFGIQLELGSTATSFEPYVGGTASPNPDYPQEVQTVTGRQVVTISDGGSESQEYEINLGKNLFNKDNISILNGYFEHSGDIIHSQANNRVFYIPCEPNTRYSITQGTSTLSNHVFQIATTSITPAVGVTVSWFFDAGSDNVANYLTASDAKYMVVRIRAGDDVSTFWDGVQIEKGSSITAYAPYFTPIELCKIGDYQDYIYSVNGDWYLHKETKKLDVSALTGWYYNSNTNFRTTTGVSDIKFPSSSDVVGDILCPDYSALSGNAAATSTYDYGIALGGADYVSIRNKNLTSLAELNTYFANNQIYAYVVLATPTDTQITNSALIAQLNALNAGTTYDGTTIITVASENLAGPLEVKASATIAKTYTEVEIGSPFTIADVEGKSSNTTLDGNVYVDWAYNKKQYSFDLFNLTPQDYADIRAFYDYQFSNSAFPTITVPELNIDRLPVYMEISSRNIINQCLLTDKLTIKFRETVQP